MTATRRKTSEGTDDLRDIARMAKLRYVTHRTPGYSRIGGGRGFHYRKPDGSQLTDEAELARIRKLAIPPAYRDVWICRDPSGHLQAVGRDARGRRQYRYHPRWRLVRDEAKFSKMLLFGARLPRIRAQVDHDLARHGLPREKVLAAVVRLLERTLVRVGNEEYARANRSFGLTTLRNRHVKVEGGRIAFDFRGKSGIEHHVDLSDRRLGRIVARCQDLPGQELFQYLDEDGAAHAIGSEDVNDYLHAIAGEEITAKDFRTWAATNLAAMALAELEAYDSAAHAKKNVLQAIEAVARLLGNTASVCRKCYIHPAILEGYLDGSLLTALRRRAGALLKADAGLTAEEAAVAAFLKERLEAAGRA